MLDGGLDTCASILFAGLKDPAGLCYFQFSLVIAPTEATNYVEQNLSVCCSPVEEITLILWNPMIHYSV